MAKPGKIIPAVLSSQRPSLEQTLGRCWTSQEIRQALQEGQLVAPTFSEKQIQPSSFEPTLGHEAFILDTEQRGLFSPGPGKTIYHSLLEVPSRRRPRIDLYKDPVLRRGFT